MNSPFPMVRLGEVLTQYTEFIEAPEPRLYPKLSVRLYGRGAVLDTPVHGAALKMKRHQVAKAGQVILSEIWGKKGAIGYVPPSGDGALCTSHFFLFDVHTEKIDPRYLQAIFTANYLENQLGGKAKGTTGYAAVRPKHLLAAAIPLPPLDEQRRIVARIEVLAAKIEEARELRRQASIAVDSLASHHRDRFFELNAHAVEMGMVTEVIDPNPSHRYPVYEPDGVPMISTVDFTGEDGINTQNTKRVPISFYEDTLGRFNVRDGDVIFSRKGKIGYARLHPPGTKLAMTHTLCVIQPDRSKLLPRYLLHFARSGVFLQHLSGTMNPNTGVPTLGLGVIRSSPINVPSLLRQQEIVDRLEETGQLLQQLRILQGRMSKEIDVLLPSILDKAFKGEL
ncbi:restriction endonuclease subunit S [Nitrolancea hollandica]|uniref:Putative Restriction endonuclease S subunits n=1 Tax=Nitrolancea hollandica Lb TaxID=1129897 RepID=I4ED39_9BACT|nr:restriction endonuclease subunit S [Nitrolancea hollandica]CCF82601.1 putative Restriction endonuclease S subunits [Nitrolancea hollandica Lb]